MIHVSPHSFINIVRELYASGVRGLLLSGGFRSNGTLPIEPYLDKLRIVKSEFNLIISAHLGLVTNRDILYCLRGLIDIVDYEFTLSSFIVNYVRGFNFSPERYVKSLVRIIGSGLRVIPHVYAWHPEINKDIFREELRVISDFGIEEITLLTYIDPFKTYEPIKLAKVVESYVEYARRVFPGRIYMGCMRPGYIKSLLDPVLVSRGLVDRVANPYYKVLREHPGEIYDACCSVQLDHLVREQFLVRKTYKAPSSE